jgi:hypothetical protein
MYIANEKYDTNIAEYLLYMYHIEDIIRSSGFDEAVLEQNVVSKYNLPPHQMSEIKHWYHGLMRDMQREGVEKSGHLAILTDLANELNDIHIQMLNTLEEERYKELYQWVKVYIKELKSKMNNPALTEMEVCLNGLYGFMLIRMQGREISEETAQGMSAFSQILRIVSQKFHDKYSNA